MRKFSALLLGLILGSGIATLGQYNTNTGRMYSGLPLTGTSSSIGGGALLAGACSTTTVAITGAAAGMSVIVTPQTNPGVGSIWYGYVSSSNTVTVAVCGIVALTPSSVVYNVRVLP